MLKVKVLSNTGNELCFNVYNEIEKYMRFRYRCKLLDASGQEVYFEPCKDSYKPNVFVDIQKSKKVFIRLNKDIEVGMVFKCIIEEKDNHLNAEIHNHTFSFRFMRNEWEEI